MDKRIQEDHLEHLAFFSEYGRLTFERRQESMEKDGGAVTQGASQRPFQYLDFLVRDYQVGNLSGVQRT